MLAQYVATRIRADISDGKFMPGQQLNEVRAAQHYEVSRNTLREAFAMLAAERIVDRIPHRGVFIAVPDADFVTDLYRARAAIEPAGALWGQFLDAEALVALTDDAAQALGRGDIEVIGGINQRFHRELVASVGSATLDSEMGSLLARMRLAFLEVLPHDPTLHADHVDGNAHVARLLADGKRDEAARTLHDSLLGTCKRIVATLEAAAD